MIPLYCFELVHLWQFITAAMRELTQGRRVFSFLALTPTSSTLVPLDSEAQLQTGCSLWGSLTLQAGLQWILMLYPKYSWHSGDTPNNEKIPVRDLKFSPNASSVNCFRLLLLRCGPQTNSCRVVLVNDQGEAQNHRACLRRTESDLQFNKICRRFACTLEVEICF